MEARIIETWTPNSTVHCRPWTIGRWVWLTYGDLTYQWLTSTQTWTPRSVFCRPPSLPLHDSRLQVWQLTYIDHESMVHVLGLQLWGEIRIPEVLGSNTQTSSLYLKLRLTDLGLEVLVFEPYAWSNKTCKCNVMNHRLSISAVTHKVLSLAEGDLRSIKYRPRSWGLDGRKSLVYQVFIGQSDTTSYGPRSTVNCTIGCPGLDNPGFQWFSNLHCPRSTVGWGLKIKSWPINSAIANFTVFGHTFTIKIDSNLRKKFLDPWVGPKNKFWNPPKNQYWNCRKKHQKKNTKPMKI